MIVNTEIIVEMYFNTVWVTIEGSRLFFAFANQKYFRARTMFSNIFININLHLFGLSADFKGLQHISQ